MVNTTARLTLRTMDFSDMMVSLPTSPGIPTRAGRSLTRSAQWYYADATLYYQRLWCYATANSYDQEILPSLARITGRARARSNAPSAAARHTGRPHPYGRERDQCHGRRAFDFGGQCLEYRAAGR